MSPEPTVDVPLTDDDLSRIVAWFVAAYRDVRGSCGPEANDLVQRRIPTEHRAVAP